MSNKSRNRNRQTPRLATWEDWNDTFPMSVEQLMDLEPDELRHLQLVERQIHIRDNPRRIH